MRFTIEIVTHANYIQYKVLDSHGITCIDVHTDVDQIRGIFTPSAETVLHGIGLLLPVAADITIKRRHYLSDSWDN